MTSPAAPSPVAHQRRPGRARRRASSPVALAAWATVAGLLTYGQLERADEESADAVVAIEPDAAAVAAAPEAADSPAVVAAGGAPALAFPEIAAPSVVLEASPALRLVPAPTLVVRAVPAPSAPFPVGGTATVARARSDAAPPASAPRPRATAPKRPFAALSHPKLAFASPLLMPRLHLPRVLEPRLGVIRGLLARARPGEPVAVRLSAYCLRGATRQGSPARTGIVAADPRVFPLARHVELYAAGRYLGRYLVDDTGHHIKGSRIDIWTPDCDDARRFGMREGVAALVAVGH